LSVLPRAPKRSAMLEPRPLPKRGYKAPAVTTGTPMPSVAQAHVSKVSILRVRGQVLKFGRRLFSKNNLRHADRFAAAMCASKSGPHRRHPHMVFMRPAAFVGAGYSLRPRGFNLRCGQYRGASRWFLSSGEGKECFGDSSLSYRLGYLFSILWLAPGSSQMSQFARPEGNCRA